MPTLMMCATYRDSRDGHCLEPSVTYIAIALTSTRIINHEEAATQRLYRCIRTHSGQPFELRRYPQNMTRTCV